ncbi:hypothetical protein ACN47E_006174 [Coniothyrium glycines]
MARQRGGRRKDVDHEDATETEDDDDYSYSSSTAFPYTSVTKSTPTPAITGFPFEETTHRPPWLDKVSRRPNWPPISSDDEYYASVRSYSTSESTLYPVGGFTEQSSTLTWTVSQGGLPSSNAAADDSGSHPPNWGLQQKDGNPASLYVAASIVPVVVLVLIGAIVLVCLRRRKRRRREAATAQMAAHELKKQPQVTVQQYNAPRRMMSSQSLPHHDQLPPTSTPSQMAPVILGPIPSGSNGAYLTGMDTSDMVSIISSNRRPREQYADSSSLVEPPPPYRPNSAAPPSFYSTSRQSSVRTSGPPQATSRTHLMEGSPFEDPYDEDSVSELSGPTRGRHGDSLSAVSDLSYQHDPFADRRRSE